MFCCKIVCVSPRTVFMSPPHKTVYQVSHEFKNVRPTFLGALFFSGWQNDCWRGSEFGPCYVPHISLVQRAAITVLAVVPEMWLMAKRKLSKERKKAGRCLSEGEKHLTHLTFRRCFQFFFDWKTCASSSSVRQWRLPVARRLRHCFAGSFCHGSRKVASFEVQN